MGVTTNLSALLLTAALGTSAIAGDNTEKVPYPSPEADKRFGVLVPSRCVFSDSVRGPSYVTKECIDDADLSDHMRREQQRKAFLENELKNTDSPARWLVIKLMIDEMKDDVIAFNKLSARQKETLLNQLSTQEKETLLNKLSAAQKDTGLTPLGSIAPNPAP